MRCELDVEMKLVVRVDDNIMMYYNMYDYAPLSQLDSGDLQEAFSYIINDNMMYERVRLADMVVDLTPGIVKSVSPIEHSVDEWSVILDMNLAVIIDDYLFMDYAELLAKGTQELTNDNMVVIWEEILHDIMKGHIGQFGRTRAIFYPISVTRVSC